MAIWFTADTHFGHKNILKYHDRPWADVNEMEGGMIARWNERVKPNDVIYHLGDFAFVGRTKAEGIFTRLNGEKHLVMGNHDSKAIRQLPWATVQRMAEVSINGRLIVLCHYAMKVWRDSHHGSLQLYGHSHGSMAGTTQSCDVGVDCWDWYPVGLPAILDRMRMSDEYHTGDHHGQHTN